MGTVKLMTIEDIYISPFTARRKYDEDGRLTWIPLERNLTPTGIGPLDFIAQSMSSGNSDLKWMARTLGCTTSDLWGMVRALTGMDGSEFRLAYIFRLADDLLRYTNLPIKEVARRSGCYSSSCLSQQFMKHRGVTPKIQRKRLRGDRDAGRYRV